MEEEDASRFIPSPKNTQKAKTKQDALKTGTWVAISISMPFFFSSLLLFLALPSSLFSSITLLAFGLALPSLGHLVLLSGK
ncbi:unnamed protein product [Prunus armeniaca]|uniref:Uncharacterized protein n=1 Tax=Prunus armeniaca TaxID=36596 RepID=A0A6J5VC43_PRUAR|nr:unnamed protein product [Prunus armeniaca]